MKLIIDARFLGLEHAGIGRYTKGLIEYLKPPESWEVVLIVNKDHAHDPKIAKYRLIVTKYHPYSFLSQFELIYLLSREKPDLLHVPHFTIPLLWRGKMVVTIHDLIKHESKGKNTTTRSPLLYWIKYLGYLTTVFVAIKKASQILVPSKYWKNKLKEKYGSHLPITVTYEGVDEIYFMAGHPLEIALKKPYVIYIGNVYPHKNVETIIKAITTLKGEIHLYISCARSVFWKRLEEIIHKENAWDFVTHLGFVADENLVWLLKNSLSFVTASKIEGLGLPGLEAMAAGTAVISSNSSCLPEIYGNAASYFDPDNALELAQKIVYMQKHPQERKKMVERGKNQVKRYSWGRMSEQTVAIYKQAMDL